MGVFFDAMYWSHVVIGIASVPAGFIALFAAKGSPIHRAAGKAFTVLILIAAVGGGIFPFLPESGASMVFLWIGLLSGLPAISAVLAWNRSAIAATGDKIMFLVFAFVAAAAAYSEVWFPAA